MQRNKTIAYDDDELYSDEYDYGDEDQSEEYTEEDKKNFATLTPVVRAEIEEAGLQASDREIEDALWNYYWDLAKSVAYLKNAKQPKGDGVGQGKKKGEGKGKKEEKGKVGSRFDQAAERNTGAGVSADVSQPSISAASCFSNIPWTNVPSYLQGHLIPSAPCPPPPRLLGGSSKLAKLAEERRRKAAAAFTVPVQEAPNGSFSSLDRLSRPKDAKENAIPEPKAESKKYPIRRKREPTPPPREPTPEPEEVKEEGPKLRASPTSFGRALSASDVQVRSSAKMALGDLMGEEVPEDPFNGPRTNKSKSTPKNDLAKKTEALKLDAKDSPPAAPAQPKVKSKGLDVPKLWAEEKAKRKPSAAFVVVGHVDHGKSTLMGRLLLDTGAVSQRDIDKYRKQATELGKSSFALAWVMDTGSEERERGVTVDIAQHHFSTPTADFTILDAPGHRDFVPNMIGGASMADLAVLVVDANQLESGMKGQTKEHILLAKACGISRVVAAVNKMDAIAPTPWDERVFKDVRAEVSKLLISAGFAEEDVRVVPCSGLNGENVAQAAEKSGAMACVGSGYSSLLQELEGAASTAREVGVEEVTGPLRMQITDVFRGGVQNPLSVSGRISAGNVQVGDGAVVQPSGESAQIKGVEVAGEGRDWAVAGELCTLHLTDIEAQHLRSGDMLCSSSKPVAVTTDLSIRVQALESLLPMGVDVHIGRLHVPGAIKALVETLDAAGGVLKKRPRVVKEGQRAVVKVELEEGAPVERGSRVVLRRDGETVAAGRVV